MFIGTLELGCVCAQSCSEEVVGLLVCVEEGNSNHFNKTLDFFFLSTDARKENLYLFV